MDIRGGSQDLSKFSLDFMPAPVYTCTSRFLQGVSVAASPVLAIVGSRPSVCLSVRHTLALSENDAS